MFLADNITLQSYDVSSANGTEQESHIGGRLVLDDSEVTIRANRFSVLGPMREDGQRDVFSISEDGRVIQLPPVIKMHSKYETDVTSHINENATFNVK